MAPLISSSSNPSQATGARAPWPTQFVPADKLVRQSEAALVLVRLREVVAAGKEPTENIMGSIAEAARSLSGATGAAIAMPCGDGVECVGRSVEPAPELASPGRGSDGLAE